MSEAQYLSEHGPQNPNARTAVLIGSMLISKAAEFEQEVFCSICGYSPGNNVEPGWGVQHAGDSETHAELFLVCPECSKQDGWYPVHTLNIRKGPDVFDYVMRQVARRTPKGCLAEVRAFAGNGEAWYVIPTETGFLMVVGPNPVDTEIEFDQTVICGKLGDKSHTEQLARMALGAILGTCTIKQFNFPLSVFDVTGNPYTGPIPLPAKVVKKVQQQLDQQKASPACTDEAN